MGQLTQMRDTLQSLNDAADAAADATTEAGTKMSPRGGTQPGTDPALFKPVRVSMPYEK